MIAMRITKDNATPAVKSLVDKLRRPKGLHAVMAEAVMTKLEDHFMERSLGGNKMGWPTRRTWLKIRDATGLAKCNNDHALIAISHPAMRQKFYGSEVLGPITPKQGSHLAIPATAAAYAAGSPSEDKTPALKAMLMFNENRQHWMLALVNMHNQAGMKQVKDRRKGRQGQMRWVTDPKNPAGVWYWLVRKSFVPRDPNAIPSEQLLHAYASAAAALYLKEAS